MRFTGPFSIVVAALLLVTAACGGDGDSEGATTTEAAESTTTEQTTTTAESTTTEQETTTTEATATSDDATTDSTSETGLPATPVATFLSQTYLFGSEQGGPSDDQLPFPADTVTAHWYQSDGFYAVVYGGLDPTLVLCPGNSIRTATQFEFVSNAPLNDADCSFAPVVAEPPNGVVTCDRMVSYVTLIPAGTEGLLFGTIETMVDGLGVGLTSQVPADPANMPEIERSLIDC